ncbi:uncharacterized protein Tco025E_03844 [Trypanosoma conorhini]|uniref:C-type lectin domain-containing protein n=1 Tax=Trypanosoma conorhini TaxID=83891 RepID=A0A3R7MT64_9TRYP|nr:uncharacterized protein Tco025E_03844 [Trypanosoma conorhini]RNF20272.1 hypothetical protein Tco025E_03844 [Trypanosoma conorhini]
MRTRHRCRAQFGAPAWAPPPLQLLLLLLATWAACCCVAAAAQGNAAATFSCPIGWTLWSPPSQPRGDAPADAAAALCVQPQRLRVAPAEVADVCARIFDLYPPRGWSGAARELAPRAISVHSDEQNAWLRDLLQPLFAATGEPVALGGAAGFGDVAWWDGVDAGGGAPQYAHFAPAVDWRTRSGCIAMQPDGYWRLVDCKTPRRAFACSFPLPAAAEGSGEGGGSEHGGESPSPPTEAPAGDEPVLPPQPTRPPVPTRPPRVSPGGRRTRRNVTASTRPRSTKRRRRGAAATAGGRSRRRGSFVRHSIPASPSLAC